MLNAERNITNDTPSNMIADVMYRLGANYSRKNDLQTAKQYIVKLDNMNEDTYKIRQNVFLGYLYRNQSDDNTQLHDKTSLQYFVKAIQCVVKHQV